MSYSRTVSSARFRPRLESLEDRYCPAAPAISLTAVVQPNNQIVLIGQVDDEETNGLTVTFSGQYEGSAVTNADGSFEVTVDVAGSGTIQASVTDNEDLTASGGDCVTLHPAPGITLSVTPLDRRNVLLTGQVTDDNPGGLTVQFSGQFNGDVVTAADGSFAISVEALDLGNISASVTNLAGLTSSVAVGAVTSRAPAILNFHAVHEVDNYFTFYGSVDDEWAAGLQISFSSAFNAVNGQTVTVEEDGTFHFTVNLSEGDCGLVAATVADWWGQASDEAETYVDVSH